MWLRVASRYGDFVNSGEVGYVWDMTDPGAHISNKPEFSIRYGYELFKHKGGIRSFKERVGAIAALSDYSQVALSAGEFSMLLIGGRAGRALRHVVKRILGEEYVERLHALLEHKRK